MTPAVGHWFRRMGQGVSALALGGCALFQNTGPNVPDWSAADQAGNPTENQRLLGPKPTDAGASE